MERVGEVGEPLVSALGRERVLRRGRSSRSRRSRPPARTRRQRGSRRNLDHHADFHLPGRLPGLLDCSRARVEHRHGLAVLGERRDHREHHFQRVCRRGPQQPPATGPRGPRAGRARAGFRARPGKGSPRACSAGKGAACPHRRRECGGQGQSLQPCREVVVGGELLLLRGKRLDVRGTETPYAGDRLPRRRSRLLRRRPPASRRWRRLRSCARPGSAPARRSGPSAREPFFPLGRATLVLVHELLPGVHVNGARVPVQDERRPLLQRRAGLPRARPRPGSRASGPGWRCARLALPCAVAIPWTSSRSSEAVSAGVRSGAITIPRSTKARPLPSPPELGDNLSSDTGQVFRPRPEIVVVEAPVAGCHRFGCRVPCLRRR